MEHYKDLKSELAEIDNKLLELEEANQPKKERKKALHEIFEMKKKVKKNKKGTKH